MSPEPAAWYFSPELSLVFVYVLPLVLVGGAALRFFFRAALENKRARDAKRAAHAESDTLDEGDTILRGRAELDDPKCAVRVTIEQAGSEAESSGSWSVKWTELRRRVDVAPFYVVHASGERVRVEPGNKTMLASSLAATERVDHTHRRRTAEVAEGQEVWITGELAKGLDPKAGGGYRGARSWVMRPARDGTMRVATDLPEASFRRRARVARFWSVVFSLVLSAMMALHLEYHALVGSGREVVATLTEKHIDHGDDSDTYVFQLEADSDRAVTTHDRLSVTWQTYDKWQPGATFPALASFGTFACIEPGFGARALMAPTILTFVVWLGLMVVAMAWRPREWHEGARVDESESGRL